MARFRFSSSRPLNERGFSLMEIMLVCGLVGITSMAIVSLMENVNTQMTGARNKTDAASVVMAVQAALKNPDSCKFTLQHSNTNTSGGQFGLSHVAYYDGSGNPTANIIGTTSPITPFPIDIKGSSFLQVKSMKLTKPSDATLPPIPLLGTADLWAADLVVTFQQKNNTNVSMKPYVIAGMVMQSDVSGNIVACKLGLSESCITAYETNGGTPVISSADSTYSGSPNGVFKNETTGTEWGMSCQTGWKMTGCSASALKPVTSVTTLRNMNGQCMAAKVADSQTPGVSRVYLTCCSQ